MSLVRHLIRAMLVVGTLLLGGASEAAVLQRTNYTLTVTPTGSTALTVSPGAAFAISGSWSAAYNGNGCAGCPTQLYLVFFAPVGQPGDPPNLGQINLFDSVIAPVNLPSASGTYSATFTAPTRPGTYYISANHTLNFPSAFSSGVAGGFSLPDLWAYEVTIPAAPAAAVPAPAGLLVIGGGLLGLALTRARPGRG